MLSARNGSDAGPASAMHSGESEWSVTGFEERIEGTGVLAIVRLEDYARAIEMATAIVDGGVTAIEFTYTNPNAGEAIARVKAALGARALIGAGTVLDPETARA